MLTTNLKKLFISILFAVVSLSLFAETPDLGKKFLDKASEAFEAEEQDIEAAYKNINSALKISGETGDVVAYAKIIYEAKLKNLIENYDPLELVDIQTNLDKYPTIATSKIKKLIKQIELEQEAIEKAEAQKEAEAQRQEQKAQFDRQQKAQKEQFDKQQQVQKEQFSIQQTALQEQTDAMKKQAQAIQEQAEATKKSNEELMDALETGLNDLGEGFNESAKATQRSTRVIALSIIGIAFLILLIVFCVIILVRKGFKQQQIQQEQYVQAFKLLAANQSQTNRLMLGGVTDLYGNNPTLRLAGTSTWAPAAALPDVEFSEQDQEELKQLAIKCEEIGSSIDQVTGRKNNSKNVSELVYKLSMQLGLPQGMAMVNFCASMIYDAGFLGIDPELLAAKTLTPEQKNAMKDHVKLAEKHLDFVPKKYWSVFEDAAMKHHENIDGSGYPKGLKGDEIPQIARLIRVAESYVSLSSKRNYRDPMDKETAVQTLMDQPQFYDIDVVKCLDKIV